MVYICAEETNFLQFYVKPDREDWETTFTQFTVKGHNWVSLGYCDFNSYLAIARLIHEENLGVCDHEITQMKQFVETVYGMKYQKCLENF